MLSTEAAVSLTDCYGKSVSLFADSDYLRPWPLNNREQEAELYVELLAEDEEHYLVLLPAEAYGSSRFLSVKKEHVMPNESRFLYSFSVWPDEEIGLSQAVFQLFQMLGTRVEMEFSENKFNIFRDELQKNGLLLREIERIPACEPETVV